MWQFTVFLMYLNKYLNFTCLYNKIIHKIIKIFRSKYITREEIQHLFFICTAQNSYNAFYKIHKQVTDILFTLYSPGKKQNDDKMTCNMLSMLYSSASICMLTSATVKH